MTYGACGAPDIAARCHGITARPEVFSFPDFVLSRLRLSKQPEVSLMRIEGSEFGKITIDGRTYEHDVIIRLSGDVEKRRKKLSKRQYGTSHMISKAEAKFAFEKGCDVVIVGSGHQGNVQLSPEARDFFEKKHCDVILQPTPEAIRTFKQSKAHKIGLIHVTC
jgi:hypothetical protein